MGQVITKLRIDTDEYQNRIRRAAASLSDMAHQCEVAGNRIAVNNKYNLDMVRSLGQMQTASTTLRGKVGELSSAFIEASHAYNQLTQHEKGTRYGEALAASIEKLKTRLREAQTELRALEAESNGKSAGGVSFGSKFMQGMVPGLGMGVGAAGALAAVQLTQKAIGLMKDTVIETINENRNFEQANANLAAVLGKTRDEIGALTENAKQLGATTFYTAGQITDLQTVLARLGFTQSQILAMTKDISNLAIATGTDLAQAAQLAGSTMRAFGMKASEMERITSVLGVSTTKSALTTEALATALQYVATDATNAGFSLEDTVALLGTLMNNGIQASTAGTSLRQILIQMSTANGKLARSFGTTVHSLDEFVDAIHKVKDEGDGTIGSLSDKVRVTARSSLLALGANIDKAQELREQITDVGDELQKMADTQLNTLQGSVTLMQSAWNGLMLTFEESNSTLKKTADWLTEVINKAVEWRKLKNGGESALSLFTKDPNQALAESRFAMMKAQAEQNLATSGALNGVTDEKEIATAISDEIKRLIDEEVKKLEVLDSDYQRVQDSIDDIPNKVGFWGDQSAALQQQYGRLNKLNAMYPLAEKNQYGVIDWSTQLLPTRGALRTDIGTWKFASGLADAMVSNDVFSNGSDETDAEKILAALNANKKKTPAEKAADIVASAQEAYAEALNKAAIEKEAGLLDEEEYSTKLLRAEESLMDSYSRAAAISGSDEYKTAFENEVKEVQKLAEQTAALTKSRKDAEESEKEAKRAADEAAKELLRLDRSLLSSINSSVGSSGWNQISRTDNGAMKARFDALKTQLIKGIEIPNDVWEQFVKDLNDKLESMKLPTIKLDFDTNTVTKELTKLESFKNGMSDWQNGLGSIVSGVDALTSTIETMKKAVKDDASAWDVMKSVISSTFSIMQMVVTVMETINTLTAIGTALKLAKSEATATDTATTIADTAATGAHTGVEAADAAATAVSASASAADAVAKGAKSVAWIPIVGAVLAVAAAGGIAAAIVAANKKTEYHADGGLVGMGGPRGTDTVNTWLTPGELVLNRAQQNNLAGQLVGSARQQNIVITGRLSGRDILLAADAENRSRGGSRGYYAKTR